MKRDYMARMHVIMERFDNLAMGQLTVERDINHGELLEDYYKDRLADVSHCKDTLFNIALEIASLVREIVEQNQKFDQACKDPQVEELWQVIETAMTMVK